MLLKKIILVFVAGAFGATAVAQKVALRNDLIMDGMASVNLGLEFKTGVRTTINIPASFNLWDFTDDKKFRHFASQPEFRWWSCAPFTGHFFGIHAHYSLFNVGGVGPFKTIKNNRYEGWLAGAGVSYGYNFILSPRWSLEASLGIGYAYMSYDKYPSGKCQPLTRHRNRHYFGPTKLGVAVVFLIK